MRYATHVLTIKFSQSHVTIVFFDTFRTFNLYNNKTFLTLVMVFIMWKLKYYFFRENLFNNAYQFLLMLIYHKALFPKWYFRLIIWRFIPLLFQSVLIEILSVMTGEEISPAHSVTFFLFIPLQKRGKILE